MSSILFSFKDFLEWMKNSQGWSKDYNPKENQCYDRPSEYPCIAINNYCQDYDGRQRDHLEFVTLDDFFYDNKIIDIIRNKLKEYDQESLDNE